MTNCPEDNGSLTGTKSTDEINTYDAFIRFGNGRGIARF
jgi:hypothetical protein